jgi:integrase
VILDYAKRCGTLVGDVSLGDLELGETTSPPEPAYFTRDQASRIISEASEPYHTMFAVAWLTGLRAGELLALSVDDLDFDRRTIRVRKSADDQTRVIHQTKTKKSTATLPHAVRIGRAVAELPNPSLEAEYTRPVISEP